MGILGQSLGNWALILNLYLASWEGSFAADMATEAYTALRVGLSFIHICVCVYIYIISSPEVAQK